MYCSLERGATVATLEPSDSHVPLKEFRHTRQLSEAALFVMLRNVRERLRARRRRADTPSDEKQPNLFRNRSLDQHGRAKRWFLRPRRPPSPHLDRPPPHTPPPQSDDRRNDDSFSSLPSTHASRDPFLNDDVPVEISRLEPREDRPRPSALQPVDRSSPPASTSSASTSRKRSALWKGIHDPNSLQSPHEHDILATVALSDAVVKHRSVSAAADLVRLLHSQIIAMSASSNHVARRIDETNAVATSLPSSSHAAYAQLLYAEETEPESDAERAFLELHWTERLWDVEAMIAERRYDDAVASIAKLQADGVASSSPRTYGKFQVLLLEVVSQMSFACASGAPDAAAVYAPLLTRLGMADHARQVILAAARKDLTSQLRSLSSNSHEIAPRMVNVLLDMSLSIFRKTYAIHMWISCQETNSSSFIAWVVQQCDAIYGDFLSPVLNRMRKADPVTILATIEAARHRKVPVEDALRQDEKSLVALLETRITAHVKSGIDEPIREAERQLVDRAKMYASAIPRNWKDGPYQSGKAVCDDLNVLSRRLESALMNLGPEVDVLTGNLLVRPALVYCTNLLEMGTKAFTEDDDLTPAEVQEGVFETFTIIGKTILRLHQKFASIPMLERVSTALMSPNLGEVRILQAELFARGSHVPGEGKLSELSRQGTDEERATSKVGRTLGESGRDAPGEGSGFRALACGELSQSREQTLSYEEQARRLLAQQRARIR